MDETPKQSLADMLEEALLSDRNRELVNEFLLPIGLVIMLVVALWVASQ